MPEYLRAYCDRATDGDGDGGPIRFVASTEGVARDGMIINADAWDLGNYTRNNVVLWSHDYFGTRPPIGRADVSVEKRQLIADVTFDNGDAFAADIERKVRSGFLNAVSVGWDTLEMAPPQGADQPARITKADLLDISVVPVPADPNALKERQKRGLTSVVDELTKIIEPESDHDAAMRAVANRQVRGAIPPNTGGPKAAEDASWDGPGEVAKAEADRETLRRMHAWVDGDADPDMKAAYKFPHHRADGTLVFKALAAGFARLDQANIPEADKDGVARHLAAHYREFDKEPPERSTDPPPARATWDETAAAMVRVFRPFAQRPDEEREPEYRRLAREYSRHKKTAPEFQTNAQLEALGADERRGLFLEGEPELFPDEFAWLDVRAGAALNVRNRERLEQAASLITEVLNSAKKQADDEEERAISELVANLDDIFAGVPS